MRRKIILGNWKMNGNFSDISILCSGLNAIKKDTVDLVVCVPFVYLDFVRSKINNIKIGAQSVSKYDNGAYTGEISASMLKDLDCEYVIIGHSERRTLFNETNEIVAQKAKEATSHDIVPIICVGENLDERNTGRLEHVIETQVEILFQHLSLSDLEDIVIAYEPLWAIGTGLAATPSQVQSAHQFIRSIVAKFNAALAKNIRIVYGGSLNISNAKMLLNLDDVDGGLVGGSSLDCTAFSEIINQV